MLSLFINVEISRKRDGSMRRQIKVEAMQSKAKREPSTQRQYFLFCLNRLYKYSIKSAQENDIQAHRM